MLQFIHDDQEVLLNTINGQDQTISEVDDSGVDNDRVQITLIGNQMTANIKFLNIRITATWHTDRQFRYINYHVLVPQFLCEISSGHLGNCDGDPGNERPGPNDRE